MTLIGFHVVTQETNETSLSEDTICIMPAFLVSTQDTIETS